MLSLSDSEIDCSNIVWGPLWCGRPRGVGRLLLHILLGIEALCLLRIGGGRGSWTGTRVCM